MNPKKPNIVFILNDHQIHYRHGWDNGVRPLTPNFSQLASEGARMNRAYSTSPLCGPVRRSMLNGLYPHTHKHFYNDSDKPYEEESYLKLLNQNGYKNFYFGKWHAGPGTPITEHDCEGFSCNNYGNPYITDRYKAYLKERNLKTASHKIEFNFSPESHSKFFEGLEVGVDYTCEDFWCGEHAVGITTTSKESHEAFFLANLACDKLEELARRDEPFHLRVDFWGPHQPFFPTQEYIDLYDPDDIQLYGNHFDTLDNKPEVHRTDVNRGISHNKKLITPSTLDWSEWQLILSRAYAHQTMVDDAGGRILKKLKTLGLDKNTIVIWSTDHGDALASHGGHFDKCSYMSEEVMRIPMAIKWPDVIRPGTEINSFVANMDIPTTILAAAGIKFSTSVDGKNLLDCISDEKKYGRSGLMCETYGHGYAERVIGRMYVEDRYKYVNFHGQLEELYNLNVDPYELDNLAVKDKYKDLKQYMKDKLIKEQELSQDPHVLD